MIANKKKQNIIIEFQEEEALVFFEWLHIFNATGHNSVFQDQAEERILFNLESELEKVIDSTFESNYKEILSRARQKIRDKSI